MFTFLYVKANSMEIGEVDSNSSWKDLLFPHDPNLAQKPPYLVGTVLNGLVIAHVLLNGCFC